MLAPDQKQERRNHGQQRTRRHLTEADLVLLGEFSDREGIVRVNRLEPGSGDP